MSQIENDIVTIVIPLIPQHDFEIKNILKTLVGESDLVAEVIICRSESVGFESQILGKFNKMASEVKFLKPIRVSSVLEVARDGTNRNRGWKMVKSKYTAFIDADDDYHPSRIEKLVQILECSNADAVLHNYKSDGSFENMDDDRKIPVFHKIFLKEGPEENTLRQFIDEKGNELRMHFAHLTVKTDLRETLQFSSRFPGADWEMANKIVENGYEMVYSPEELSAWKRDRSLRYRFRLFRMAMLRFLKQSLNINRIAKRR